VGGERGGEGCLASSRAGLGLAVPPLEGAVVLAEVGPLAGPRRPALLDRRRLDLSLGV